MNKDTMAFTLLGVALGAVLTFGFMSSTGYKEPSPMMKNETASTMTSDKNDEGMSMDAMTEALFHKKGDAFDKAFMTMMIEHHEGAIAMANLIPEQGKHAELKQLGQDIIAAQTSEIAMMKQWLKDWGYEGEPGDMSMDDMDHSTMNHQ